MKIGLASLVGIEPMPFPELLARAKAGGLESVEVNVGPSYRPIGNATYPGHLDLAAIVRDGPGAVAELTAQHSIEITSLAPMVNLLTANESLREERITYMRLTIDAARVLGLNTVVTFAGSAFGMHFWGMPGVGPHHPTNHVAENVQIFRDVYGPLADYAADKGIRIAFETAGRGGPEGNLAHSPELWDMMFDALPSPALGLSLDPSHLVWLQIPDPAEVIRAYGSRIYHVDGKDTEIFPARLARQGILGSGWWRYRLPGLGELDWKVIFSALRDIGYDDVISIENEDSLCPGLNGAIWSARWLRTQLLPSGAGQVDDVI